MPSPTDEPTTDIDTTKEQAPLVCCPSCGSTEVVQAHKLGGLLWTWHEAARCLSCGHRFRVDRAAFKHLRRPLLGEPFETPVDRYFYVGDLPMRAGHALTCVLGLVVSLVVGGYAVAWLDHDLAIVVFLPVLYAFWWLGRWLWPPAEFIPGKCPKCRYDLRGLTEDYCPECGTEIDAADRQEANRFSGPSSRA